MVKSFELVLNIQVEPEVLYKSWLDSEKHSAFTGSKAIIDPSINGIYSAWDGYITGKTFELEENKRILQTWRTSEFQENSEDSLLELIISKTSNGSKLILRHTKIPDRQSENYKEGWEEFYFEPMRQYFKKLLNS